MPFSFIPCSGSTTNPTPGPMPTRVRALEDRIACEITFPRLLGYRYDLPSERLTATFTDDSQLALSTADIPTKTENAPIVGERSIHTLDDLKRRRANEVAFLLAKLTLEKYFRDDDGNDKPWLFPAAARRSPSAGSPSASRCKDNTFPQLLLLIEFAHDAADRIYQAIVASAPTARRRSSRSCAPTTRSARPATSTSTRPGRSTRPIPDKCHVSHVVADTGLLGAEAGPGARGHARGRPLRQEPEPRLHDPLHAQRRGAAVLSPTSSRASTTAHGPAGPAEPDHRGDRRDEARTRPPRWRRRGRSGCRP